MNDEPMPNALLVEDDSADRLEIRLHLELMGFVVYDTPSALEAKEIFTLRDYSIVLLHLSHAPMQALELCRWIRAASTVPIIMLTVREELIDEAMAMKAGADDYVTKPIEGKILTSRVTQQIKRGETQRSPRANILVWGPLSLDLSQHHFQVEGNTVNLTNTEYQFLQLLMENPQRIFTRNQVLEAIGHMQSEKANHIVDSHASRLRTKIIKNGGPKVIDVVRSVGFRLSEKSNPQ